MGVPWDMVIAIVFNFPVEVYTEEWTVVQFKIPCRERLCNHYIAIACCFAVTTTLVFVSDPDGPSRLCQNEPSSGFSCSLLSNIMNTSVMLRFPARRCEICGHCNKWMTWNC